MVNRFTSFAIAIAIAALAPAASLNAQPVPRQVAIDYANQGAIEDWYTADDQSIFLMDRTGRWYRADFVGICPRLRIQNTIGFRTSVTGRFDALGSVVTRDGICAVRSLTASERPAAKGLKGRAR